MTVLGPFSKVNSLVAEKLSTVYVLILAGVKEGRLQHRPTRLTLLWTSGEPRRAGG